MHRSGTSLVTSLAHSIGAYCGPSRQLLPADDGNLNGYWEYRPLQRLNNAVLSWVGASWSSPPNDEQREILVRLAESGQFRVRALQLLLQMDRKNSFWCWKDPRLAVLLPFWEPLWGNMRYLVTIRNPEHVAQSLSARYGIPFEEGGFLWQKYYEALDQHDTIRNRRSLVIGFERLTEKPRRECARLSMFVTGSNTTPTKDALTRMASLVDTNFVHFDNRQSEPEVRLTQKQRNIWERFDNLTTQ